VPLLLRQRHNVACG